MRSPRCLAAAATTALALALPASPAGADTTPVPGTVSAGVGATVALDVPVPAGVEPVRLRAHLTVDAPDPAALDEVRISVGRRIAATVPAESARVSFRLRSSDVTRAGVLPLHLSLVPRDGAVRRTGGCDDFPEGLASLEDIELTVSGREEAPKTVADFLPAAARSVDVAIARDADDDLLAAALHTVAAISSRYGGSVDVTLTEPGTRRSGSGRRVVVLVAGGGDTTTTIDRSSGVPTLTITGTAEGIAGAATALTVPALALADASDTTGLAATPADRDPVTSVSLAELGSGPVQLAGTGRAEQQVRLLPDVFGGPVDGLHVSLRGTHSALPAGSDARFDTYFNGILLDSTRLTDDDALEVDVDVPTSALGADDNLVVALTSTPTQGRCGEVTGAPVEVTLDPRASMLTATPGDGPGGFVAFPPAFGGDLPVVFGGAAGDHWRAASDAASLVAALQRQAARPLTVTAEDLGDVLDEQTAAALLLFPTAGEASHAALPLELGKERELGPDGFAVAIDGSYAVLEASRTDDGTRLLTLASWSDDAAGPSASSARLARSIDSWTALAGSDVYLVSPGSAPAGFDSGAVGYPAQVAASPDTQADDPSGSNADDDGTTLTRQLVGAGIAVLFLAIVVTVGFRIARNRRRDAAG